ncbi:type I-C CRISPR-associated protein Cas8c/Csd1 [Chromobacterium phragmitis]|uniref:Type I-C CRISPR-associated protein Cas8c/Csd1 n=1 Tax=Chromobacterium phragmitis TaxID=2202141 RepID=A0A344UNI0_9NEIS|nr:type I-C CRISPR-associated protein Cas8c/Csd1 [Chromobacterium phragmitis]AXE36828.1 type I-C CRISPR-associated protein Cas8c/Csd1 [Chromobacterium phragmitis]
MILTELLDYYQRQAALGAVPRFGFSSEKISYALLLNAAGQLVDLPRDIRVAKGKRQEGRVLNVPQPEKRTAGIRANFLWDKTSYVLGVGAKSGGRVADEHAAFKALHAKWLADSGDEGLRALRRFLQDWRPEQFDAFPPELQEGLRDANVVFRLDGRREYVHESPAAQQLRARMLAEGGGETGMCLVSGETAPLARLHPAIKGVNGAQSSGASIVSFNLESFASYGKRQGANAPISEFAAFAYTAALNHLLRREEDNRQRLQIGDATVVFWARAASAEGAAAAEAAFADWLDPPADDASETQRALAALQDIADGRPVAELGLRLEPDTRLFVLGLAPNASRLSIRFWECGRLESFAARLAAHYRDLELAPSPWKRPPGVWRLLYAVAAQGKAENVPPQLAGELARSILGGGRYPRSLLVNAIMRMRADGELSGTRVALCKAVLGRDQRLGVAGINLELPVSLDIANRDPGYLLGRLFAELESIQRGALGEKINATIRDRYYGAASATPANVFPLLLRNAQHHLSRLRKDKPGLWKTLERDLADIIHGLDAPLPRNLGVAAQGQFAIGYYHQAHAHYHNKGGDAAVSEETEE